MGSYTQKHFDFLIYFGTNNLPVVTPRSLWPLCLVVKDTFWDMVDEMSLGASFPFKSTDEKDHAYVAGSKAL